MNVGILYPTVAALIEKMASLFPGLTVVGPEPDEMASYDKRILPLARAAGRVAEWRELGLDVRFDLRPYSEIDFSKFDLLIESVETFGYSKDWKNHCTRVECPILVKVCWYEHEKYLPVEYVEKVKRFPLLLEMPAHLDNWRRSPFTDVTCVPEPVGDWWFNIPWTGEIDRILFVLAGKDLWRPADRTVCGVDWWERIKERFPRQTYHHDGAYDFKTARDMTELMSRYRCFVNLDRAEARPLAAVFTEAVSAGMPVAARRHPSLSYHKYIDGNGVCTEDFEEMCGFLDRCLKDHWYAECCGRQSRAIGWANFSTAAVRPVYEAAARRAQEEFK